MLITHQNNFGYISTRVQNASTYLISSIINTKDQFNVKDFTELQNLFLSSWFNISYPKQPVFDLFL